MIMFVWVCIDDAVGPLGEEVGEMESVEVEEPGTERVCGRVSVPGVERVCGRESVPGTDRVCGRESVLGRDRVCGRVSVPGVERVCGSERVCGADRVRGSDMVCGAEWVCKEESVKVTARELVGVVVKLVPVRVRTRVFETVHSNIVVTPSRQDAPLPVTSASATNTQRLPWRTF